MEESKIRKFISLVRCMRAAQQEYSKSRSPYALGDAKDYEGKVDKVLEELAAFDAPPPLKRQIENKQYTLDL